ncbi:hypothetical protein [Streptomyces griseorubiginosus]|uniref:hypothetical protein n=1 Tax=Streptomyces griseorubiginosus TaxID=67304 RepID=UPI001AD70238|nr:hypothetical protein [Streptomyces griseorubiginosus]MBO4256987.1 hypothetical protein [Streptomyces griseorubiginosus]
MRRTTVGAAAVGCVLSASSTLASAGAATATGPADSTAVHSATSGQGLARTDLPVLVVPDTDLAPGPDRLNESR